MDNDTKMIGPYAIEKVGPHYRVTEVGVERYRSKFVRACTTWAENHLSDALDKSWSMREHGHMTTNETPAPRPIHAIAADIKANWPNVNYAAEPYLDAMRYLDKITDFYFEDDAKGIVIRFLGNARSWTGPKAREIKAELKAIAGLK